jgi:hypothetical protein
MYYIRKNIIENMDIEKSKKADISSKLFFKDPMWIHCAT